MKSGHLYQQEIHRVVRFEIVDEYAIHLTFDDHTEQVIDFKPVLTGPIFGPLLDRALFDQVKLEENFGTLEWPNGADISPSVLYEWPEHLASILARREELAVAAS